MGDYTFTANMSEDGKRVTILPIDVIREILQRFICVAKVRVQGRLHSQYLSQERQLN